MDAPAKDRRGTGLPAVVTKYREVTRAINRVNQMVLQTCQMGRQMTWCHNVCPFMLRCAAQIAFATCKALGLVNGKTTMWECQWDILKQRYFDGPAFGTPGPRLGLVVHAPIWLPHPKVCAHCGKGRLHWVCGACDTPMHITCFGPADDTE